MVPGLGADVTLPGRVEGYDISWDLCSPSLLMPVVCPELDAHPNTGYHGCLCGRRKAGRASKPQ